MDGAWVGLGMDLSGKGGMSDLSWNPNRRDFLRATSVMALSGAASLAEALGEEEVKPVRVAVVGTGARGSDLIRALNTIERAHLVAVCDHYPPHLEQGIRYAGGETKGYADLSRMLEVEKPEALIIATPLVAHYEMCLRAMEAGCAVFCEKTMCYSETEAEDLMHRVEASRTIFQVGLQRRANPIYRQAVAMVEAGMLGEISAIKCQWHRNHSWRRPVPVPRHSPEWNDLEHRLNWRLYWKTSQGLMAELGSHQLDVANWILGTTPSKVMASGGIDYWQDGREVFDNVFCLYEYSVPRGFGKAKDGENHTVRVTYSSLQSNAFEGASELVMGSKGTLFLTQKKGLFFREGVVAEEANLAAGRVEEEAAILTAGATLKMANDPWAHRGKPYELDIEGDDTREELVSFLRDVATGNRQTICPARVGYENAKTILKANAAMKGNRGVEDV